MTSWMSSGTYLTGTILFTVYGQLVFKWQADKLPSVPPGFSGKAHYLFDVMTNLWILSSFAAAYVAALFWLAALRTMDGPPMSMFSMASEIVTSGFAVTASKG